MKPFILFLLVAVVASVHPARAQSDEQYPPMAPNPSAQYDQSDEDYDEGDNVADTESGYMTDAPAVDDETFNDSLSGYGAWVTVSGIGRVWRPYPTVVGSTFQPYVSNGHWVYTDVGWTWVSDWDWGWAPFHYGRWWLDDYYGWVWVPGYTWGPAWVSWRWGGGYVGWMPLAPWGFHYHRNYWERSWCFVNESGFTSEHVSSRREPPSQVMVVRARTAPGSSHSGPPVGNIAHASGTVVRARSLNDSGALPVQNVLRPRPMNPGGSGGAGMIREPTMRPSPVMRPQETVVQPQEIRRSQPQYERPAPVARPSPIPVERPAPVMQPSRMVERPSEFRPSARPAMAPAQPQPSSVQRPPAMAPHPTAAPVVAHPAPAKNQSKK